MECGVGKNSGRSADSLARVKSDFQFFDQLQIGNELLLFAVSSFFVLRGKMDEGCTVAVTYGARWNG